MIIWFWRFSQELYYLSWLTKLTLLSGGWSEFIGHWACKNECKRTGFTRSMQRFPDHDSFHAGNSFGHQFHYPGHNYPCHSRIDSSSPLTKLWFTQVTDCSLRTHILQHNRVSKAWHDICTTDPMHVTLSTLMLTHYTEAGEDPSPQGNGGWVGGFGWWWVWNRWLVIL